MKRKTFNSQIHILTFSYLLLSIPTALAAALVNLPWTTTSVLSRSLTFLSRPPDFSPVCVDVAQHSQWSNGTQKSGSFDASDCGTALTSLKQSVGNYTNLRYDYYSKELFPDDSPPDGWGLPYGAESGKPPNFWLKFISGKTEEGLLKFPLGSCVAIVRMTRDFSDDAFPWYGGYFLTSGASGIEIDEWSRLLLLLDGLLLVCLAELKLPGWVADANNNIIVAFWNKGSIMDQRYGIHAQLVPQHSLNISDLDTSFI